MAKSKKSTSAVKSRKTSDVKVVKKAASTKKSEVKVTSSNRVIAADRIVYTYVLLLTSIGKGYACFAFKGSGKNKSVVVAAFCHPNDRARFSKVRARAVCARRLERPLKSEEGAPAMEPVKVTLSPDSKVADVVAAAVDAGINMPSWARRAWARKSFYMTLANDHLNNDALLEKMVKDNKEEGPAILMSLYKEQRNRADNMADYLW